METTLETERLTLRPWHTDDAEALYELARDPAIGPAAGWSPHTSVADSRNVIESILAPPETYALVLKKTGLLVGSIGAFASRAEDALDGDMEIGYWVGRAYWGRGLAPEATMALLRRCFDTLGCERVWCGYFDGNEKSRRVQEKCGFVYHHTEYDKLWPTTGEIKTEHFTCLTKREFDERCNS